MIRVLLLCLAVAACTAAPRKSVDPDFGGGAARSALHVAGETATTRTVVQAIARPGDPARPWGLVVHVADAAGFPAISRLAAGPAVLGWHPLGRRIAGPLMAESAVIPLTDPEFRAAAASGMALRIDGARRRYSASVPAALFVQGLLE